MGRNLRFGCKIPSNQLPRMNSDLDAGWVNQVGRVHVWLRHAIRWDGTVSWALKMKNKNLALNSRYNRRYHWVSSVVNGVPIMLHQICLMINARKTAAP